MISNKFYILLISLPLLFLFKTNTCKAQMKEINEYNFKGKISKSVDLRCTSLEDCSIRNIIYFDSTGKSNLGLSLIRDKVESASIYFYDIHGKLQVYVEDDIKNFLKEIQDVNHTFYIDELKLYTDTLSGIIVTYNYDVQNKIIIENKTNKLFNQKNTTITKLNNSNKIEYILYHLEKTEKNIINNLSSDSVYYQYNEQGELKYKIGFLKGEKVSLVTLKNQLECKYEIFAGNSTWTSIHTKFDIHKNPIEKIYKNSKGVTTYSVMYKYEYDKFGNIIKLYSSNDGKKYNLDSKNLFFYYN